MGILDDAIREHLELKRRLGADDDELARLEGEAFGPPSRPGDADFPGQPQPESATATQQATGEQPLASDVQPPTGEAEAASAPPAEAPPAAPEAPEVPAEAPSGEQPAAPPEPPPSSEPAGPVFHDQEAVEAVEAPAEQPPLAPQTDEQEIVERPPTDEEPALEGPATDEEPALGESDTGERPIESLDTVEHHFEGAIEDTGEGEVVEGELAEEDEEDEEDEDVLEDTPEFLRDAPEDDELWFEQGEPKDFDF